MRRPILAISGLAATVTALVTLKSGPDAGQAASALPGDQPPAVAAGVDPTASAGPVAVAPTPSATGARPSARPSASGSRSPSARPTAARTTPAPKQTNAPRPTTAAPPPATRTVYGSTVSYRYGSLRVQLTVSGTKIVNATATGMPASGESGRKSDAVQGAYSGTSGQVVQRQGAGLDTVSDATYTSDAYRQSLQSALGQL
jgi:uncharacterized protein with FMN-binding domain